MLKLGGRAPPPVEPPPGMYSSRCRSFRDMVVVSYGEITKCCMQVRAKDHMKHVSMHKNMYSLLACGAHFFLLIKSLRKSR